MSLGQLFAMLPVVNGIRRRRGIQHRLNAVQELRSLGLPPFTERLKPPPELLDPDRPAGAPPGRLTVAED